MSGSDAYGQRNNASLKLRERDLQQTICRQVRQGQEDAAQESQRRLRAVRDELIKRGRA